MHDASPARVTRLQPAETRVFRGAGGRGRGGAVVKRKPKMHDASNLEECPDHRSSRSGRGRSACQEGLKKTEHSGKRQARPSVDDCGIASLASTDESCRMSTSRPRRGRGGKAFRLPEVDKSNLKDERNTEKSSEMLRLTKEKTPPELAVIAEYEKKVKLLQQELEKAKSEANKEPEFQDTLDVELWQRELLKHCFGDFDGCSVTCHEAETGSKAIFEGSKEKVCEHQLKMLKELKSLKEEHMSLPPEIFSILSSDKGKHYLNHQIKSKLPDVCVIVESGKLTVGAKGQDALKNGMCILKETLHGKETKKCESEIPQENLQTLKSSLENKYLVSVTWNETGHQIDVEGIKDHVILAMKDVENVSAQHGTMEITKNISGPPAMFLYRHQKGKIEGFSRDVTFSKSDDSETDFVVTVRGTRTVIEKFQQKLTKMMEDVSVRSWDLASEFKNDEDLPLILKGFGHDTLRDKFSFLEGQRECLIMTDLPTMEPFVKKTQVSDAKPGKPTTSKSKDRSDTDFTLPVTSTCQLLVKRDGDITREASDILVCALCKTADLTSTRVGLAFRKSCPSLQESLTEQQEGQPDDDVLVTEGSFPPLKCQAVCYIILNPWDRDQSPKQLTDAINSVLKKAADLQAKSISFPGLGCGRALRFPEHDIAKIFLKCISEAKTDIPFQNITVLTNNQSLYQEFTDLSPEFAQLSSQKSADAQDASPGSESEETNTEESDIESDQEDENVDNELTKPEKAIICIVAKGTATIDDLWSNVKSVIEKFCLHEEIFSQDMYQFWPEASLKHIALEARKHFVSVEFQCDPGTTATTFVIKGMKEDVDKLKHIIYQDFYKWSHSLPKKVIYSQTAPNRGTVDFLGFAASSDERYPSYWTLGKPKDAVSPGVLGKMINLFSNKVWPFKSKDKHKKAQVTQEHKSANLVDVEPEIKAAIINLVQATWDPNKTGFGEDARGLKNLKPYTIKVTDVKRVENEATYELYALGRRHLFQRMHREGRLCQPIEKVGRSGQPLETTKHLEDILKSELYHEINEHYLFHGTKPEIADLLLEKGLDPTVFSLAAMLGKGIYLAETFTKSDQYTDPADNRSPLETELCMFLTRTLLGNVFSLDETHASTQTRDPNQKLSRAPCMTCKKDRCSCKPQHLYNSVMADGKWIFREFVVYHGHQCYPEYLIKYVRTRPT